MSKVAEQLRQAREKRNLTVHEVAEVTKIRTDHIRALEAADYDVFPAPVYIRGFIRTYGAFLKLNVPQLIDEVNAELATSEKHREMHYTTETRHSLVDTLMFLLSKINWKIALPVFLGLIVLAIGISSYRAYETRKSKNPLADLGPGLYTPAKKSQGETLPLPPVKK